MKSENVRARQGNAEAGRRRTKNASPAALLDKEEYKRTATKFAPQHLIRAACSQPMRLGVGPLGDASTLERRHLYSEYAGEATATTPRVMSALNNAKENKNNRNN